MNVPVVDITDLSSDDLSARRRVAAELGAACRDVGFLSVVGHGIESPVVHGVFDQMHRLFALPEPRKLHWVGGPDHTNRGYDAFRGRHLGPDGSVDLSEGFMFGPEFLTETSGSPMQGPNVWPDLTGFREPVEAYHEAAMRLAERVLAAMALSLDLPADYFEQFHRAPVCTLRLLHYPPRPADAGVGEIGAGAHTDWGAVTVLAQDDAGSLEVRAKDGTWVGVEPVEGAFVVNVGDLLARWTNDRYTSTMHRVVGVPGRDRYSVACFFDLDHTAVVECLPTCTTPADPPRYPPTTAGQHLMERYEASLID